MSKQSVVRLWAIWGYPMDGFEKLTVRNKTGDSFLKLKGVSRVHVGCCYRLPQLLSDRPDVSVKSRGGWTIYKKAGECE